MRPHRLRMSAFGPFPGTVEVDLDRLAAGGLFLLHGETGAGKTTVLDGLGFALFGRVPGPRGRTGRLRCDQAEAGVRTEVELEVTLGGRRWRITRSPAQQRAKVRGPGVTAEPAKVLLQVWTDGGWSTRSTRLDEAAGELDALLGMSADQFFQVVLLPQGEFARFLRAESLERGALLQRLFATERFGAVEDWLAARRAVTAAEAASAGQELGVLAARLAQAAQVDPPVEVAPDWPAQLLHRCEELRADADRAARRAARARDAARAAAEEATRLDRRQHRRRAALLVRDLLATQAPERALVVEELTAANRAAELAPLLAEAAERRLAHRRAQVAEAAARAVLPPLGLTGREAPDVLTAAAAAARARAGRLEGLQGLADDLGAERAAAVEAEREAERCSADRERLAATLALLPDRRTAALADLDRRRSAAVELPAARARLQSAAGGVEQARLLAVAVDLEADLRDEHLLARETAVSLREKEAELRDSRLTSMVAELAARLVPGAPCEVCGSAQHPDPYEGVGEGVSREDEDRARLAADQAARTAAELGERLAAASATAAVHRQRLSAAGQAGTGPAGLERVRAAAAGEVDRLASVVDRLDPAVAAVELLDSEQARGGAALAAAGAAGAAARRRAADAAGRAARLERRLAGELDGAADLAGALAAATRNADVCDAVVEAAGRAGRAAGESARAQHAAAAAAAAAGFDDVEQARAALRSAAWRAEATRSGRDDDDRHAASAAALADPDLAVPLEPAADVEGTTSRLGQADADVEQAVGVLAAARGRVDQVAALAPLVDAAAAALTPLQERAGRVRRLADLCAGGGANALRMTLTSFVLAARLEEVAAAASGRLLRMSQGRYALWHTDAAARGGARSGLGLLVRDSWTGRDRETSTLSGGETFQASLALALGLADVVQAEAGGTRIEALFVDEGFGTLDEESLDEVMDVLDGLREGGRVVGVVSHVAGLKARIPAQVHVRKDRRGSSVVLSGC